MDATQISPWARQAVSVMYAAEVLNGKGRNDFDPKSKATRAEVVSVMRSYLELVSD
ncbi:MAG: S-layer homology domain-containing protein [Clostridiales bacterium]|nr:S-layer homology domain-containing protein [Clostridiales bacterium]